MSNQQVQYTLSLKDMLSKELDKANLSAQKLEGTMGGLRNVMGALGVAGGVMGLVQFGKSVIEAGTKVQDATTGLTTLLKDSKAAATVIRNTMEDATKAPFGFDSLLMANKALISSGKSASMAREDVMNLANAIAATGGGDDELQRMVVNLQQISNTGEATAMDLKQFAFAGINLTKVMEGAGIKLAKGQQATYEQITTALRKAHEEGGIYFNGLENMAENTSVKISNLEDAMFQLKNQIFTGVAPSLNKLVASMTDAVNWAMQSEEKIKALAIGAGTLYTALKLAIPMMEGMGMATTAMLGPLGIIIAGIALLTDGLYAYADAQDYVKNRANNAFKSESENIKAALTERTNMYVQQGMKQAEAVKFVSEATKKTYVQDLADVQKQIESTTSQISFLKQQGFSGRASDYEKTLANLQTEKSRLEGGLAGVNEFAGGTKTPSAGLSSAGANAANPTPSKSKSVAQGTKVTTINVSIKDLIGEYNMNVSNVREGSEKVKQMVVDALVGAVNDFQLIVQ